MIARCLLILFKMHPLVFRSARAQVRHPSQKKRDSPWLWKRLQTNLSTTLPQCGVQFCSSTLARTRICHLDRRYFNPIWNRHTPVFMPSTFLRRKGTTPAIRFGISRRVPAAGRSNDAALKELAEATGGHLYLGPWDLRDVVKRLRKEMVRAVTECTELGRRTAALRSFA